MRETNGSDARSEAERAERMERAERAEMFSFHHNILREAGPLPRKIDGADYLKPALGDGSIGGRS